MDLSKSPPVMGQYIHRLIREFSGSQDPYKKLKDSFNNIALDIYPDLLDRVRKASDPFEAAVRFAIAGNIIDSGAVHNLTKSYIIEIIAKGQGNYETLSNEDKNIFFILKAKCPVIASNIGCEIGSLIIKVTG